MTKDDFEYDSQARAAYLPLTGEIAPGSVVMTVSISDAVNVDYDRDGTILGIEFLDVDRDPKTYG